jgi:hypothetical protein
MANIIIQLSIIFAYYIKLGKEFVFLETGRKVLVTYAWGRKVLVGPTGLLSLKIGKTPRTEQRRGSQSHKDRLERST